MGRADRGEQKGYAKNAVHGVPTPSRGSRGGGDKARGPASALEDLMKRKGVDEAWTALEEMQRQGATTDKYTVSRMLMKTVSPAGDGRARLNPARVYRGITLVEHFIELQPKDVDEVLFNALLDTCCRLKDLERLEATVRRMKELKVTPSPVTLGILVKTYGQAGDLQKVLQVWEEMETQRHQANAVTYGCMIDACVKCGHMAKAVDIFKGMREQGKHRNTILYTTLIKGYGLEKDLKNALFLFREMPVEGVPYNTITYNSMLDACVKCGDLPTAEGLLREMKAPESTLEPDLITFSTLLKGYCNVGELDKALQVAEAIKGCGLRCDELVYNTLMDGCVKAGDVSAGIGLFEEMVQNGMQPSTITHSILSRLYQRAGYEDAAEAVAQLYQHHGVERPTAGDRGGKGASRRSGRDRQSPAGSPHSGAHTRDRSQSVYSDGGWSMQSGYPGADPSAPSTPLAGSPLGSPARRGQPYLPMDAFGAFLAPPLPGGDTPQGSAMAPMAFGGFSTMPYGGHMSPSGMMHGSAAASMAGSHAGTPHGSPHHGPASQQAFFAVSTSPQATHPTYAAAGHQGAVPQMPPWPVAQYPGAMPNSAPMHDAQYQGGMQQVIAMPMMQDGSSPANGMHMAPMQMPQMPYQPHDPSAGGAPGQQQAYFSGWYSNGEQPQGF